MEERMRALEDALVIAQAQESDEPHPLLATPWKLDEDESAKDSGEADMEGKVEDMADILGALHIDGKERSNKFFGPTGGVESLLFDKKAPTTKLPPAPSAREVITPADLRALGIPEEVDVFFYHFPFTPIGIPPDPARRAIESCIPPFDRAMELSKIMLEHMSWMFQIVSLRYMTKDLIPSVYGFDFNRGRKVPSCGPHDLALLLIVCALGALVDTTQEPYNEEALRYYVLAQAAIGLDSMLENNSLATIRFLHLLSIYNGMCGKESALSNTYALLNIAGILSQRIGLHVDPSHFGLDEKTSYERRSNFWNLVQGDMWQSLGTGRPPCMVNVARGCRLPTEEEEARFQEGEIPAGFGVWGHKYTRDFLVPLNIFINAAKQPSYQSVLELDRKFRALALPDVPAHGDPTSVPVSMRIWVRSHYIELILLYLHRGFFAQAIATHLENPLASPYAYSFITAYQCACHMLKTTRDCFELHANLMTRVWMIWTFNFTSAMIIAGAAMCPKPLKLDPPPAVMLEEACALFTDAGKINSRAAKALPLLLRMREKVREVQQAHANPSSSSSFSIKQDPGITEDSERIAIFGGKTRLVASTGDTPMLAHATPPQAPIPDSQGWPDAQQSYTSYYYPQEPHAVEETYHQPTQEHWAPDPHASTYEPYQYIFSADGESAPSFIPTDSWAAFLQGHGALPKPA
ncbi:hypothetical protein K474DRAFT_1704716 [Panus rudis PR-1116 ss-1]|nr:hypothetical protein K474DRAFT_1704716 [Panus rudis PR-1116 ss-1]